MATTLLQDPTAEIAEDQKTSFSRGSLKTKLTNYERWKIGKLYQENEGLVKFFGNQLIGKFPEVPPVEIFSCINIAFVKAARTWDEKKGKFSTVLGYFCLGEVRHYKRTNAYWGYSVDFKIRELGQKARRLITHRNVPMSILHGILGCTKEELRVALEATLQVVAISGELHNGPKRFTGCSKDFYTVMANEENEEEDCDWYNEEESLEGPSS